MDGDRIQFSLDTNQKYAQDMAEEIKQKVRNKISKRYGPRDKSSSIEQDSVESFKSMYQGQSLAITVVKMLKDKDTIRGKAARCWIHIGKGGNRRVLARVLT
ncbi:hypothetical protein BKA57DRAFT_510912 [Linnemannia elongata]|nr:hypothetical protein BKA57DRAFT_510912 [Linnemannia elongata]